MNLVSYGHSDAGYVRETNEDSYLVDDERGIYVVADGVGGLPHGDLASRLAVQFFQAMIRDGHEGEGARKGGHTSEVPSPAVPRLVDTGT